MSLARELWRCTCFGQAAARTHGGSWKCCGMYACMHAAVMPRAKPCRAAAVEAKNHANAYAH